MNLVSSHDGTIFNENPGCVVSVVRRILDVEKTIYIYIYFFLHESIPRHSNKSNNYNIELEEIVYIDGNCNGDVTDVNRERFND